MSALTDLKARITDAEGHLRDRTTIAAELERAIAEESLRAHTGLAELAKKKGAEIIEVSIQLETDTSAPTFYGDNFSEAEGYALDWLINQADKEAK